MEDKTLKISSLKISSLKISSLKINIKITMLKLFILLLLINYFPPIFLIWIENRPLNACFLRLLANWKMSESECPDHSEFQIFSSPNYSKFAIEYDWISEIFEMCTKFGLFSEKKIFFFSKKKLNFVNKVDVANLH